MPLLVQGLESPAQFVDSSAPLSLASEVTRESIKDAKNTNTDNLINDTHQRRYAGYKDKADIYQDVI